MDPTEPVPCREDLTDTGSQEIQADTGEHQERVRVRATTSGDAAMLRRARKCLLVLCPPRCHTDDVPDVRTRQPLEAILRLGFAHQLRAVHLSRASPAAPGVRGGGWAPAGFVVMRWPSVDPASPQVARGSAEAVGREIVARRGPRQFLASRTNPAVATGLLLTVALGFVLVGGLVLGALAYLTRSRSELVTIDSDISQWVNDHSTRFVHDVLQVITQLGSTTFVIVAAMVPRPWRCGAGRAGGSSPSCSR